MEVFNESRFKTEISRYRIECAGRMRGKVLDVGGGLGVYLPYFGSKDVTVLDINEEALRRLNYDKKVLGDACHLPFENDVFDSIWACSVCLYITENIEEFINEASRVLKKDAGRIIIELPNPDSIWNKWKGMLGLGTWMDDKDIKHLYTVEELRKYGEVTGEVKFLPAFLDKAIRQKSKWWHTLMLEIKVGEEK